MRLLLDLLIATYWFDDALQDNLERQGFVRLTRAQSFIIANISLGEQRAGAIARNLGISRQAVSLMLADLEARGLVTFQPDPTDGRARVVGFSRAFQPQGEAARRVLRELEDELGRRIGPARLRGLRAAFQRSWGEPPVVAPAAAVAAPSQAGPGPRTRSRPSVKS